MTAAEAETMSRPTKARTAAQKRRDRRNARQGMPELAATPKRDRSGCYVERTRQQDKDPHPQEVAFTARMRQTGLTLDDVKHVMMGHKVGERLMIERVSDREDLWQAMKHMGRVILAYDRATGAPKRHPKCMSFMAEIEKMEADASSPAPDLRTEEERYRQDVAAWMALKGWLSHADYAAREACTRAVVDEPDEPITDWTGVVLALRCVVEGIKGQTIKVRARNP